MQVNNVEFIINDSEKIIIDYITPLHEMWSSDDASIFLVKGDTQYLLSQNPLHDDMSILKTLLTRALDNQLHVDSSIHQDLGYLFNECLYDKPGLTYENSDKGIYWIGMNYLLWNDELATWLYNAPGTKEIILQITPIYLGRYVNPENSEVFPSYDDWMATYKPLFTITISKDVAIKWREQAESIVKQIENNMAQYQK